MKLMREVKAALIEHCRKPYEIRTGKRHILIVIEGKIIGALSRSNKDHKDAKNIICAIKRHGT